MRYRAIRLLGRGAEADTWLFADRKRNLPIAIKLFARPVPKGLVGSILREIRLQSLLGPGHMNLINVYEVMLTRDHLGIAMVRSGAPCQPRGLLTAARQHVGAVSPLCAVCHPHRRLAPLSNLRPWCERVSTRYQAGLPGIEGA